VRERARLLLVGPAALSDARSAVGSQNDGLQELTRDEFLQFRHQDEPLWNRMAHEDLGKIWTAQTIYNGHPCSWLHVHRPGA